MPPDLAYVRPFILFPTDQSPPGRELLSHQAVTAHDGIRARRDGDRTAVRAEADPRRIGCPVATVFLALVSVALVAGRPARRSPASVDGAVVLSECGACSNRHCELARANHQSSAEEAPWPEPDSAAGLVTLARPSGNSPRKAAPASCRVTRPCRHGTRAAIVKRAHLGCRGENCGADCIAAGRGLPVSPPQAALRLRLACDGPGTTGRRSGPVGGARLDPAPTSARRRGKRQVAPAACPGRRRSKDPGTSPSLLTRAGLSARLGSAAPYPSLVSSRRPVRRRRSGRVSQDGRPQARAGGMLFRAAFDRQLLATEGAAILP